MKEIFILFFVLFISYEAFVWQKDGAVDTFGMNKEIIRTYSERFLGKEITDKYLGVGPDTVIASVVLPAIPKFVENPTQVVEQESVNKRKLPPELNAEKKLKLDYFFIEELYEAVLLRKPSKEEWESWYNTVAQGASREGIYRGLVLGEEFRQMQVSSNPPSDKMVSFTVSYLATFLHLKIKAEKLQQLNSFQIKGFCVEKSLEMIDLLVSSKESYALERWYAVLSFDLAKKYKFSAINGRSFKGADAHLVWAKKMPIDFIKSEVMIKLFQTFNQI